MSPTQLVQLATATLAAATFVIVAALDRRRLDVRLALALAAVAFALSVLPAWSTAPGPVLHRASWPVGAAVAVLLLLSFGNARPSAPIMIGIVGLGVAGAGLAAWGPAAASVVGATVGSAAVASLVGVAVGVVRANRRDHRTAAQADQTIGIGQAIAWAGVAVAAAVAPATLAAADPAAAAVHALPTAAAIAAAVAATRYAMVPPGTWWRPLAWLAASASAWVVVALVSSPDPSLASTVFGPAVGLVVVAGALVGAGAKPRISAVPHDDVRLPRRTRLTLMALQKLTDPLVVQERVVEALAELLPGARLEVLRAREAPTGVLAGARVAPAALVRHGADEGFIVGHRRHELPPAAAADLAAVGGDLLVPVRVDDRLFGLLRVEHPELDAAVIEHTRRFADLLALKIDNHRLYAAMESSRRLASLGTMASAIAHDLRTPLSAVRMNVQMLRTHAAALGPDAECVTLALREVDTLGDQIAALLDFAKPIAVEPGVVDFGALARDAVRQCAATFEDANVSAVVTADDEPVRGSADAPLLARVLVNLLENAAQASPPTAEVRLTVRREGAAVRIAVSDRGRGIDAADLPRVFDPFFTTRSEGTGLGLASAQKIVAAHGGTLAVNSRPGLGTTMTITLPQLGATSDPVAAT